jgi:hypothetical protein
MHGLHLHWHWLRRLVIRGLLRLVELVLVEIGGSLRHLLPFEDTSLLVVRTVKAVLLCYRLYVTCSGEEVIQF